MNKTLLTLQDCERKFDEKFFGQTNIGYVVDGKIVPAGKHARQQKFLRSSFIQLLQSQIEEMRGMMNIKSTRSTHAAFNEVYENGYKDCLQSLINSNEEVIAKLQEK